MISVGDIDRWFLIEWECFGDADITDFHDAAFDSLFEIENISEVNSGHTGINVMFKNDLRSATALISVIEQHVRQFVIQHKQGDSNDG